VEVEGEAECSAPVEVEGEAAAKADVEPEATEAVAALGVSAAALASAGFEGESALRSCVLRANNEL
jgi:hypothetical protein